MADVNDTNAEIVTAVKAVAEIEEKLNNQNISEADRQNLEKDNITSEKVLTELNKKLSRMDVERGKLMTMKAHSDRKVDQMSSEIKMMKDQVITHWHVSQWLIECGVCSENGFESKNQG